MLDSLWGTVQGELIGFVLGAVVVATGRVWRTQVHKSVWQLRDPSSLVICVSDSTQTDTGEYTRPATGIGQVRALATIAPHLARAYESVDLERIAFPHEVRGWGLGHDLVLLGGPVTNSVTERLFEEFGDKIPARFDGADIITSDGERHAGKIKNAKVAEEVALIVWSRNPFSDQDETRLIVLAGAHTFGTLAAAQYLTRRYGRRRRMSDDSFVEVVRARVVDGHVAKARSEFRTTF